MDSALASVSVGGRDGSMSNPHRAVLNKLNEKLEDLRMKLNEPVNKLTNESILVLTGELQPLYKQMIIYDLEGAIQRQIETYMWNDCFKTPLTHFQRNDKALFHFMIEIGVGFYLGFIHDVGIHFDISFIKNTQRSLYCTAPAVKNLLQGCPSKSSVYYIIQNSLIRVGDLLRYRGSLMEALKMYDKSTALCPTNGHPFNQMGLAQILLDNKTVDGLLAAIYYYARAVSVTNPYVAAQHNLDGLMQKIKSFIPKTKIEEFTYSFLLAIGNPATLQPNSPSFVMMLSPLVTNNSMNTNQLFRVIVIALWAWRRESNKSLLAVDSGSENTILEIIAGIINSLLIAANAYPDLISFYALAHLKLLMDWLRVNSSVLNNAAFRTKLHTGTLCIFFNQLLILENNVCGMKSKEMENVILPEEKRLLGFLPFCRTYDSLNSLMDEADTRAVWIRIYRILKCADSLSESRLGFIERHGPSGYFTEVPYGSTSGNLAQTGHAAIQAPNRRNVAFQSIFNQLSSSSSEPPYNHHHNNREFSSPIHACSPSGEQNLPVSSKTLTRNEACLSSSSSSSSAFCGTMGGGVMTPIPSNAFENNDADEFIDAPVENDPPYGYVGKTCSSSTSVSTTVSPIIDNSSQTASKGSEPFLSLSRNDLSRNSDTAPDNHSTDFSHLFCSIWTPRQSDMSKATPNTDGWAT